MIFESVLWSPSTISGTYWLRMNDDLKRINALGGQGIYDASRFLLWLVHSGPP